MDRVPDSRSSQRRYLVAMALCLIPLVFLALVVIGLIGWLHGLVMAMILTGLVALALLGQDASRALSAQRAQPELAVPEEVLRLVEDLIQPLATYRIDGQIVIEGPLALEPNAAYAELHRRFKGSELTPLLQENADGRPVLILVPTAAMHAAGARKHRSWINVALLLATLVTTTGAGAAHRGIDLLADPSRFIEGLPYALALLAILAAHEFGHFFAARRHGIGVSLPYFIPIPFALGTFGAFIRMESLASNRKQMFDVAIAGPLAGLAIAIPALLVGLQYSTVVAEPTVPGMMMGGADAGSSILFAFLARAGLGDAMLAGHGLILHPVAFAGWLGLLVTALNLIPIGQLDGGHLVHTLVGHRTARMVGIMALSALVVLGLFVWSGLLFWALLIYLIAGTSDVPPQNDVSRVGQGRMILGVGAFVLLLLILLPVPVALFDALGIHSPYL